MQLYTINATPQRYDVSDTENAKRHIGYARTVSHALSSVGIDGFTIQQVGGYWQGLSEISYTITVATDLSSDVIDNVAEILRDMYNQDAVMVTYPDNSVKFIERPQVYYNIKTQPEQVVKLLER